MHKLFRLCLWQVFLGIFTLNVLSISMLFISDTAFAQEIQSQSLESQPRGIRMRGPKSSDVFPYDRYGPITKRDTLWKIALTVRPDSRLSVYQVMEALYEANPNSFVNNNFNHLVEGEYLRIPSFDQMMSVNAAVAKQKSRKDDQAWQKQQPKKVDKEPIIPKEPSVNKKDLDTVKVEINDQLQKIDQEQQKRLTNIQNDVLDSIDGLQAILKENEDLRQKLTSFNSQLGTMQKEVAKGKEIKLQLDDMIKLQQALLEKAQAREQELLLEKQQAELEGDSVFSSSWFIVLMATLPASLILIAGAILLKRRKKETGTPEVDSKKELKDKAEQIAEEPHSEIDGIDDLSLEDELSLDNELSLDDDLTIDLLEEDDESEDDVIHLDDDDLDDLDDLEDILLDDEDVELEGGELGQDELDSLLMEGDASKEQTTQESDDIDDEQFDQNDLDDLLGDLAGEELIDEDLKPSTLEEVDIDDVLIASDSEEELLTDESLVDENDESEVSDPDDIDALLASIDVEVSDSDESVNTEMSDPNDIDALLESMEIDEDNSKEEMSDPDDIDALLESMEIDEDNTKEEMSDPDDIDALLESMEIDEGNTKEEMSDPDDIDALLESMATENELDEEPKTEKLTDEKESLSDEALAEANNSAEEMSDPDDIDALLESLDINNSHNDEPIDVIDDELTQEENQNSAKIDTLTEEYIAPLLATDFSDIKTKPIEKELVDDNGLKDDSTDDNFDSLIEEAFDEDTLAELMNEQPVEQVTELTPDFSDQNVLASLLNDDNDGKSKVSEATEINDIQELDSLDFDELLANIEEESSIAGQSVDFNENLDAGDDFSLADFDNVTSNTTVNDDQKAIEDDKNYLSVDSLLSDSQNDANYNEPYDKAKIDVGLNEFPEFTDGVNKIDVDIDENGMAAKLDLAKVYIEIGDIDNAHVILHEVVKQGDTQQQVVAQELLDNL